MQNTVLSLIGRMIVNLVTSSYVQEAAARYARKLIRQGTAALVKRILSGRTYKD